MNSTQKERILSRNAIEFFSLKELPEAKALRIARQSWGQEEKPKAAVGKGAER